MTRFTQNLTAACAALFIAVATLAPVITVPPAQATTLATMPILA